MLGDVPVDYMHCHLGHVVSSVKICKYSTVAIAWVIRITFSYYAGAKNFRKKVTRTVRCDFSLIWLICSVKLYICKYQCNALWL